MFPTTLVILIVALVAKDTSYLGDPYIMRGFAQVLCLVVGGIWVLSHIDRVLIRYWPIIGYLFAIFISVAVSREPTFVLFQVMSLTAVTLFFIGYFETERMGDYRSELFLRGTVSAYGLAMMLSLLVGWIMPHIAYETLYGGEVRFRGLFGKAGMLGSAAGLVIGIAWFGLKHWWSKLLLIIPAALCLGWTLSRTFWVALLVAWVVTAWRLKPRSRKWVVGAVIVCGLAAASIGAFKVQVDTKAVNGVLRTGSITNLTGRVELWELAIEAIKRSPFLGYGFTVGADGLQGDHAGSLGGDELSFNQARAQGRTTLHNGYVQSMLDAGMLGTFFYLAAMIVAFSRLWRRGRQERFAPYLFGFIFLLVANITQNVIYSASVYDSIFFWGLAVFALSLPDVDSRAGSESMKSHG